MFILLLICVYVVGVVGDKMRRQSKVNDCGHLPDTCGSSATAGCEPPVITDGSWHSQPGRPFFDSGLATMMLELELVLSYGQDVFLLTLIERLSTTRENFQFVMLMDAAKDIPAKDNPAVDDFWAVDIDVGCGLT